MFNVQCFFTKHANLRPSRVQCQYVNVSAQILSRDAYQSMFLLFLHILCYCCEVWGNACITNVHWRTRLQILSTLLVNAEEERINVVIVHNMRMSHAAMPLVVSYYFNIVCVISIY